MNALLIEKVEKEDGKVVITGGSVGWRTLDEAMEKWRVVQKAKDGPDAEREAAMGEFRALVGTPTSIVLAGEGHFYKPGDVYYR